MFLRPEKVSLGLLATYSGVILSQFKLVGKPPEPNQLVTPAEFKILFTLN